MWAFCIRNPWRDIYRTSSRIRTISFWRSSSNICSFSFSFFARSAFSISSLILRFTSSFRLFCSSDHISSFSRCSCAFDLRTTAARWWQLAARTRSSSWRNRSVALNLAPNPASFHFWHIWPETVKQRPCQNVHYWAKMGFDKNLGNYVRFRRVCKGYESLVKLNSKRY